MIRQTISTRKTGLAALYERSMTYFYATTCMWSCGLPKYGAITHESMHMPLLCSCMSDWPDAVPLSIGSTNWLFFLVSRCSQTCCRPNRNEERKTPQSSQLTDITHTVRDPFEQRSQLELIIALSGLSMIIEYTDLFSFPYYKLQTGWFHNLTTIILFISDM